jgi:methionyl-tRNA formyltransferase
MRVMFLGTDRIGEMCLRAVADSAHEIVLVITQPDRPSGRGMKIAPGVVRVASGELGMPVIQPESIKDSTVREKLEILKPDILAVVSYGEYIPSSIYEAPPHRAINVHPSLLPRWRGASPTRYALLAGDTVTGVTIQYLHKKLDAGDILLQETVKIEPDDDHGSLCEKLYPLGARMLVEALDGLERSGITAVPQDEAMVTRAPKIGKSDLNIDWSVSAVEIRNRIRAFSPEPGSRTSFREANCKLFGTSSNIRPSGEGHEAGTIVALSKEGPCVACGDGVLTLTKLQPAGKKAMDGGAFVNGYRPGIGERFTMVEEARDA